MITLLSAHSFRKCFNTGESKDMVRVFRSNFPSNLCYHETELCQLWRQQIDKVQLVLAIYVNFWNENAKKNPMFLKKKLKILWRGNRSLTHYLTPKICRSTLLASIGRIQTLVSFSRLLAATLGHCPLIPPSITFCKTAKRLFHKQCNKNEIADEQFCNVLTVRKF